MEDSNSRMEVWFSAIDESGMDFQSRYAVVSLVIGGSNSWPPVYIGWKDTLDKYGLPYYHGTDFNGGTGVAKNLTKKERIECVKKLITVVSGVDLEYVTFTVAHDQFIRKAEEHDVTQLSVYDYLLASAISFFAIKMDALKAQSKVEHIGVIAIEEGCSLDTTISRAFMNIAFRGGMGALRNVTFYPKIEIPCQIADMIAYDSFKVIESGIVNTQNRSIKIEHRKSFEKLLQGNPLRPFVLDDSWLDQDLPQAKRFLADIGALP